MTGPMPGEETYPGPPPTRHPGGGPGYPMPWRGQWGPGPYGAGPHAPAPWAPPPWAPPPWGQAPWGQAPWGQAPWGQAPWGPPPPHPGMRWEPPPGTPPHDVPRTFLLAMRTRTWRWWRPLVGLLLILVGYALTATVVLLVEMIGFAAAGVGMDELLDASVLMEFTDPVALLFLNLSLAVAIPCVWAGWAAAHGTRVGWSSSVLGRLRWRLVVPYTRLALLTLGIGIGVSVLVSLLFTDEEMGSGPDSTFVWLLLVVLLTTPLQSAAEEYLCRGYLSQAIAGWIRHPAVGAIVAGLVSALVFSALHGAQDTVTFLDRFAFGLAASAVVWLTGGLEAAIVLHAVNNVIIFVLAGALGDEPATEAYPGGIGVLFLLLSLLSMGAYVALVARSRRRLGPELHTAAQDLRLPLPAAPPSAG
jgi:membrane protease YdiL (CAAX protease family)